MILTPAWIANHMASKVWDEISYAFPNFNGATIEGQFWGQFGATSTSF